MRRGFTLLEIMVVIAILVAIVLAVWSGLSHLGTTEKTTDREASRALLQSRLAEMLQRDLRSALPKVGFDALGPKEYRIKRYVLEGDTLKVKSVIWKQESDFKISRTMEGEKPQEFNFRELLDPTSPGLTFKLEPLGDVVFGDQTPQ